MFLLVILLLTRDDDVHGDGRDDETSRRIRRESDKRVAAATCSPLVCVALKVDVE